MTPTVAWRHMLAADQALLALPRKARDRSEEAELAAEARVDFVLAVKAANRG